MFQIKGLNISHKRDLRTLLEDFSLVLNPGDKAVVIGEEGDGKSTLLRWIYDPDMVDDYIEAKGERIIMGERLGYLPQELPQADSEKYCGRDESSHSGLIRRSEGKGIASKNESFRCKCADS